LSDLAIEYESVEALIPYAANSRTHSDAQVAQIAASIKEFGWTNPILIDGDNTIIAGHGRLLAARKLGMKQVPAIRIGHLSKAQQRALVIADNQLAMNAGWDMDMLKAEIEGLKLEDFDVDLLGFSDDELKDIFSKLEDEIASLDSDKYTTKIAVPIYEVKGEKPALSDIFDRKKTLELAAEIEQSDMPSDIKAFLLAAAERHTKFNYENIAEFYAHADEPLRKLMRDSALVIIDYDEAIEGGYIKLTKELMELAGENEEL
jgi:ParB-like chromosome segregation protein Spo0J